jgi:hypothetical protein
MLNVLYRVVLRVEWKGFRTLRKKGSPDAKKGGPFPVRPALSLGLEAGDVRCLQTLGAAGYFEFNRLAFVQRLVPFRLNRGKVHENIFAGLALDEPIPFAGIEPLHCSLFSH